MRRRFLAGACAAGVVVTGCAVGPTYERPDVIDVPPEFAGIEGDPDVTGDVADLSSWWDRLNDPSLTSAVTRALENSPDVEEAAARILEARALLAAERGTRLPSVDGRAAYTRSRRSETLDGVAGIGLGGDTGEVGAGAGAGFSPETDLWQLGIGAAWEIDVFGRLRRRVEAAGRRLQSEAFDFADVRVSLAADAATAFVDARGLRRRLALALDNVALQERSLQLAQARFEGGLTTELDVAQAVANLQQTRAAVPDLRRQLQQARNRLAVLAGDLPGTPFDDTEDAGVPSADVAVAMGVPADLLRRRPDVRRAERDLAAAVADVGAAEADRFPRLSLAGTIGLASGDLGDLFDSDSRTFDIGPGVDWPLFRGGTLRALVTAAEARRGQELAVYRRTVLTAFGEVADATTALAQDRERRDVLTTSREAARRAVDLADAQYRDGLIDFDRVLLAQQTLFVAEDQLAAAETAVAADLIGLFRALGGGWQPPLDD